MKLSRRDFVHAGCTVAAASLVPSVIDRAEAFWHGSAVAAAPGLSLRNVLNINLLGVSTDYAAIDHIKYGGSNVSPFNTGFTTGTPWTAVLDANGWPNNAAANGQQFGGSFIIPDPANFPGPYIMDWDGNGQVNLNFFQASVAPVITLNSSSNVTPAGGNTAFTSTGGASKAVANISLSTSLPAGPVTVYWNVSATGTGGFFVKNLRFYRAADATDLANGLIWRSAWKQPIVNLCPSAVRFMNLIGSNSDRNCRFENRTLPNNAGYGNQAQWLASPVYGTAASGTNQYTVAAAVPTTGNPKTTPASMVHGEIATVMFTNGFARAGAVAVSGITNANPGVVTTSSAHGYLTGDIITHFFPLFSNIIATFNGTTTATIVAGNISSVIIGMYVFGPYIQPGTTVSNISGSTITLSLAATGSGAQVGIAFRAMRNLHQFPCKITVLSPTTYSLQTQAGANVDTTAFGPFSANGTVNAYQFATMQVGSGNDRVAYPMTFGDGNFPAAAFANFYLSSGETDTFWFDKTVSSQTDGAGNWIPGSWMFSSTPFQSAVGHSGDTPIEVAVALINELNAMSPAHTIGAWFNIPTWGLSSMDPDHSTASDWAVNMVDVIMNPSSSVRSAGYSALGYAGATQLNQPNVVIEYDNEVWNGGANDATGWLTQRGIQRWPTIIANSDYQDMHALRTTCMARDVKASNPPGLSRITFTIGMFGVFGLPPSGGDGAGNYATVFGGTVGVPAQAGDWYTNDTLVTGGSWGRPIDNHNGVNPATYFDPDMPYYNTISGTGTITDDAAKYLGTDNSGALSFTGQVGWVGTGHFGTGASTNIFTVDTLTSGAVGPGDLLTSSVNPSINNTKIIEQLSGTTGGTGTYLVNNFFSFTSAFAITATGFMLNVTGAVTNGPLVAGQSIAASGFDVGFNHASCIQSQLTGTAGAAGIYVLNSASQQSFAAATIKSPSNSGGNYIGAANQSAALANFVSHVKNVGDGSGQSIDLWVNTIMPQYSSTLPAGKVVINYEGGPDWPTLPGTGMYSINLNYAHSLFSIAVLNSSQWATAQVNALNSFNSISKCFMPSIYIWIQGAFLQERWAYCTPDSYATIGGTPTEGAALTVNSPVWIAMSSRNQGLPN